MSSSPRKCVRCALRTLAFPLVLLCAITPARAQEAPGSQAAPMPESEQTRFARELTLRAHERFEAGDYAGALAEFSRAYELLAGDPRQPELLNNIAVCHERMFRYDLALEYYQRYLREAHSDPADRAEVEAVVRGLKDLLGRLHLTSNVRAQVWIDDRTRGFTPEDFTLPAGRHVIRLEARGRLPAQREVEVRARTTQSVHFELEPLPEYHGIAPTYFWTGVTLTSVFLVTGMGLGLRALSLYRDARDKKEAMLLKPGDQDRMQSMALAADIVFGAAAVFAVSSTVLAFMTDFRGSGDRRVPKQVVQARRLRVRPSASPTALGLTLSGALR